MQLEAKVKQGQNIFDMALLAYNDASMVYDLIQENDNIENILTDVVGLDVVYTPVKIIKFEAVSNAKKLNNVVTIKSEQTIFDLSLQHYGDVEKVYDLVHDNDFIDSVLSSDIVGETLTLRDVKNYVTDWYIKNRVNVGTKPTMQKDLNSYLLQENGYYLLQENGYKIILE
jgi:hypothetical protein